MCLVQIKGNLVPVACPKGHLFACRARSPGVDSHWYGFNCSAMPPGTWFFQSFCFTILCMLIFVFELHGCQKAAVCLKMEPSVETKGWGKGRCQPCIHSIWWANVSQTPPTLQFAAHSQKIGQKKVTWQDRERAVGTGVESAYLVSP